MRDYWWKPLSVVALAGTVGLVLAPGAWAGPTCEKQVNAATLKYAKALVSKATTACRRSPGGMCFDVAAANMAVPSAKKLKKCDAAAIQTLFNGRCTSRDKTCVPASMTTANDVAKCISCSVKREIACLTATAFATASLPAGCQGFPSGAFLDPDDDLFAQAAAPTGSGK